MPSSVRLVVAAVAAAVCSASATGRPKHILFLMIDDLGYNDVGFSNTSDLSSPNIDALANRGVKLARYYTHNLCSPSRTAFLSGRFASTVGMQGDVILLGQPIDLPRNVTTVAERLSKGGFKTAAFGKWDAGMTTWDYTPTCRGFDYFYGFYGPAQDHYTHTAGGGLDLREDFAAVVDENTTYSTTLYTGKVQAWVQGAVQAGHADRTFVYLAYQAMHSPIEAPEQYTNDPRCSRLGPRRVYCGMMLALDEGIGNVTGTYKSLGIWNDTAVVFATDNGGHTGSSGNNWPLRGEKSTNYEGGVRGVAFLHWPGNYYSTPCPTCTPSPHAPACSLPRVSATTGVSLLTCPRSTAHPCRQASRPNCRARRATTSFTSLTGSRLLWRGRRA